MVCEQCNTQVVVGEKYCPKCGTQLKTADNKPKNIGKKIFHIIISVIFAFLISILCFFVFIIVGARLIMPILPEENRAWIFTIIFLFSIIVGILTIIPIIKIIKKIEKKNILENNKN